MCTCFVLQLLVAIRFNLLLLSVVSVRFEEPVYTFNEDDGTGEICLIKDLATVGDIIVPVSTQEVTAEGIPNLFMKLYEYSPKK